MKAERRNSDRLVQGPGRTKPLRWLSVIALIAALFASVGGSQQAVAQDPPTSTGDFRPVFAPGTAPATVAEVLDSIMGGSEPDQFDTHWNAGSTALNNGGSAQGDSLELTWSIIPDGTVMPSQFIGDTTCTSDLIATFDSVYGAGVWQAEILNVWDDWTALTGNVYSPAVTPNATGTPIDDGATWPSSSGLVNVRGDIRIGGCTIDGNSNILAYNYFPSNGDMKLESTDSFYANNPLNPAFHNVFSHEHGHGAGLGHVCPVNGTKLMEPFINLSFLGLQHDDIRGVQRGYGDRFELINNPNDTAGAATPINPVATTNETQLSMDSTSDEDWFSFSGVAGDTLDVTVAPNGFSYLEAPQNSNGSCPGGTTLNSLALQDLSFEIRDASGVLTTVNANGASLAETISGYTLPSTGNFYVRVTGTGTDAAQLYDLSATLTPGTTLLCNGLPVTIQWGPGAVATAGNDVILGTSGPDVIPALGGDDVVCGLGGADTINGGLGNDTIFGDAGADLIYGLAGNDILNGGTGADTIVGFGGNDTINGDNGNDILNGGPNDDIINGGEDDDEIYGQAGNDTLAGNNGDDVIIGLDGIDALGGGAGNDTLNGGPGNDTINGGPNDDTIFGLDGDDTLNGNNGLDLVYGQLGIDIIDGGNGNDQLWGNEEGDTITDPSGINVINGGPGNDTITGGTGNDTIYGDGNLAQAGDDIITGGPGNDNLFGFAGNDTIDSADGAADTVNGGPHTTGDSCTTDASDTVFLCNP